MDDILRDYQKAANKAAMGIGASGLAGKRKAGGQEMDSGPAKRVHQDECSLSAARGEAESKEALEFIRSFSESQVSSIVLVEPAAADEIGKLTPQVFMFAANAFFKMVCMRCVMFLD